MFRAMRQSGTVFRAGFSLLELQVSLAVLAIGLMGLHALTLRQGRQVSVLEKWCVSSPTYYVAAQSSPWMKALGAPAELHTAAGIAAWSPPVAAGGANTVTILSLQRPLDGMSLAAVATVQPLTDPNAAVSASDTGAAAVVSDLNTVVETNSKGNKKGKVK